MTAASEAQMQKYSVKSHMSFMVHILWEMMVSFEFTECNEASMLDSQQTYLKMVSLRIVGENHDLSSEF